ncbi:MAG: hypothetical protein JO372_21060 [Solirubrobacterales bacterium]|nr:hypothetical protein [Solirubrobacterales bacterium]
MFTLLPPALPTFPVAELPLELAVELVALGEPACAGLPVSAVVGVLPVAVLLGPVAVEPEPAELGVGGLVLVELAVVPPLDPAASGLPVELLLVEPGLPEALSGEVLLEPVPPRLPPGAEAAVLVEPELLVLPGLVSEPVLPVPPAEPLVALASGELVLPDPLPAPVLAVSALADPPVGLGVEAVLVEATVALAAVAVVNPVLPEAEAAEPEPSARAVPVHSEVTPTIRMLHVMATSSRTRALGIVALLYHFLAVGIHRFDIDNDLIPGKQQALTNLAQRWPAARQTSRMIGSASQHLWPPTPQWSSCGLVQSLLWWSAFIDGAVWLADRRCSQFIPL